MEQIFDSGPGFWALAPNVPKMAQNTKIVTSPTVFELESSFLRIMLTNPMAKNSWNRFLIRAPVFGAMAPNVPKMAQNTKIVTTPTVFGWHRSPLRSGFVSESVSESVSQSGSHQLFTMFPLEDLYETYTVYVSW